MIIRFMAHLNVSIRFGENVQKNKMTNSAIHFVWKQLLILETILFSIDTH